MLFSFVTGKPGLTGLGKIQGESPFIRAARMDRLSGSSFKMRRAGRALALDDPQEPVLQVYRLFPQGQQFLMRDRELYEQILGIGTPWFVEEVELRLEQGEVHVFPEARREGEVGVRRMRGEAGPV